MPVINLENITFDYGSSSGDIFKDLSLSIDTNWKLGVIGRNGKGKTTLLYLIDKKIEPMKGAVHTPLDSFYFPYEPKNDAEMTFDVVKDSIASFNEWEKRMDTLLKKSDEESITLFGEIQEIYEKSGGYEINFKIEREFEKIGLSQDLLYKPFNILSGGEQTKALITALFLRVNSFALIDEPTNHLDMRGRLNLGNYLSDKNGFIVISHDRHFLDLCIDHVLSINKNDIRINKGNFSQWKYNMEIEEEFELRKKANLEREVKHLEEAAAKSRKWSFKKEKQKVGAYDKGYITHRAAKTMKRALHIEGRIDKKIDEKKSLLKNFEKERQLKLDKNKRSKNVVLNIDNLTIKYGEREIVHNFSLTLRKGERIAIIGDNGCGKTSIFKAITSESEIDTGSIKIPSHLVYIYARQDPSWESTNLNEYLKTEGIDEVKFRNIMATLGIEGDVWKKQLSEFSRGEMKKIEFCKSFLNPYDFLLWDEPMNYLDISSREQIEDVLLRYQPTMLFAEHDRKFIDRIATRIIQL
jgi:lincosamide and streptogramin A transport system ATP-binding/permease protein